MKRKAIVREKYGAPEVMEVVELDLPIPKETEILVRVRATTFNRTDTAHVTGKPQVMRLFIGLFKPKLKIMGTDFAGVVEAVGNQVKGFEKGDLIFGFNDEGMGSYAQYIVVDQSEAVAKFPSHYSFEQAAASLEGVHYAFNFLNKIDFKKGQSILVNGASGGIGSAMVQMLVYQDAKVDAVCNTKNIKNIRAMGVSKVFNYETEDFTKIAGQKYDIIFDAVGKSSFKNCKPLLNKQGVYISSELGQNAENIYYSLFAPLLSLFSNGKKVLFPLPNNIKRSLAFITKLIEERKFTPLIDRSYEMEEIVDAYNYVASGQKSGNVIIKF